MIKKKQGCLVGLLVLGTAFWLGYCACGCREKVIDKVSDLLPGGRALKAVDRNCLDVYERNSKRYGLDSNLVKAIVKVESDFRADAVSKVGACGLMQIMPATWDEWSEKCGIEEGDVFDKEDNVFVGCAYLAWCIKHAGNQRLGIIAYNRGLTRMRSEEGKVDWYYEKVMKEYKRIKNFS